MTVWRNLAVNASGVVTISRTSEGWRALLTGGGTLTARSPQALDRRVRAVTGMELVTYQFRTGNLELDHLVRCVRMARASVRRYEDKARQLTERVVTLSSGLSQRDLAVLLGLSHQRVYQLSVRSRAVTDPVTGWG
jgi:hypothetical protein